MTIGEIVVVLVLAVIAGLAVRSLWKSHRTGGGSCNGDCSRCGSCHK